MKQRIVVRVAIIQNGKVLLVLPTRSSSSSAPNEKAYELPGSKVLPGEHPLDTLRRHIVEQMGAELTTVQLSDVVSTIRGTPLPLQIITLVYQAGLAAESRQIKPGQFIDKYVWIELSKIQLDRITEETALALQLSVAGHGKEITLLKKQSNIVKKSPNSALIIYTDGGSRGNPGPSATGYVIFDESNNNLYEGGGYLGITTNNQAEYQAVLQAMEKARSMGARRLDFRMDSLLVVNQLSGIYQIKNRDLWPIYERIKQLSQQFDKVSFRHVKREFNRLADAMVNKVLDERKV
ncbi:MAG: reverse transcriptase-like protein [Candidatus Chaera renei]|uniref:Reverse transcriptase-like protein n=1 Tax=Candidatus Chaera renei TaxID=2506947 RepID=A0A4Q0AKC2_9BACT|nr:MAG: reverse transcriptase-like protein [Candidatus Chaera renei]